MRLKKCKDYANKRIDEIEGNLLKYYAWRWLHFDEQCVEMGGFANFSHYICNKKYLEEIRELEEKLNE